MVLARSGVANPHARAHLKNNTGEYRHALPNGVDLRGVDRDAVGTFGSGVIARLPLSAYLSAFSAVTTAAAAAAAAAAAVSGGGNDCCKGRRVEELAATNELFVCPTVKSD